MNYYQSAGVQPTMIAKDKTGYYAAAGPGYPQHFTPSGLAPGPTVQPGGGMPALGQHPSAPYGQPSQAYAMASPYSGTPTYSALSSAAYGTSMPSSLATSPAGFQGIGHAGVPSTMAHISVANSLSYQQPTSYSQPTYLASPVMAGPESSPYNAQLSASNPMYANPTAYPGYSGVQMQPAQPSYPSLGYSPGLPPTRGLNPSYPGAIGFVPRYSYK